MCQKIFRTNDPKLPQTALQCCARYVGLDNHLNLIESEKLTKTQRNILVSALILCGVSEVQCDPNETGPFYSFEYGIPAGE